LNRYGMSGLLLMVVALVPLVLIIDFALLYVSFADAPKYVGVIDVPIFVAIAIAVVLSRRRKSLTVEEKKAPPTTAIDKLRERNGGRRAQESNDHSLQINEAEKGEAEVFFEGAGTENHARQVDQVLQRMKAKEIDLGVGPIAEIEGREPSEIVEPGEPADEKTTELAEVPKSKPAKEQITEPKKVEKSKGKVKNYSLSPDKLQAPAFICRCSHAHRFVCLTCGMTTEQAAKNSKTHWVEWVPEMGAMP